MGYKDYIGFRTLLFKEIRRFSQIWIQTILPPVITTALYFLIFGKVVGSRIGQMHNINYAEYIAPGLIMMTLITNAYSNVSSSFFMAKMFRSLEEILVSPMPNYLVLLGYIGGGVARGVFVAMAVTITALFFTSLSVYNIFYMILAIVFTAAVFSLAGFINALFAKKFDDVSIVPVFILTPLTYLGGVFFSIQLLPELWQKISLLNPILYFVSLFRYGMLGIADVQPGISIVFLMSFFVILYVTALVLLRKGVGIKT